MQLRTYTSSNCCLLISLDHMLLLGSCLSISSVGITHGSQLRLLSQKIKYQVDVKEYQVELTYSLATAWKLVRHRSGKSSAMMGKQDSRGIKGDGVYAT